MRRPWARFARYGSIYCGEVRRSLRGESPIFDLQTDSEHPTAMAIFTVYRDFDASGTTWGQPGVTAAGAQENPGFSGFSPFDLRQANASLTEPS